LRRKGTTSAQASEATAARLGVAVAAAASCGRAPAGCASPPPKIRRLRRMRRRSARLPPLLLRTSRSARQEDLLMVLSTQRTAWSSTRPTWKALGQGSCRTDARFMRSFDPVVHSPAGHAQGCQSPPPLRHATATSAEFRICVSLGSTYVARTDDANAGRNIDRRSCPGAPRSPAAPEESQIACRPSGRAEHRSILGGSGVPLPCPHCQLRLPLPNTPQGLHATCSWAVYYAPDPRAMHRAHGLSEGPLHEHTQLGWSPRVQSN
jgi:hypothetical protein